MKLTVLASGSTGNASIVEGKSESLAVDFGLSYRKWKKLLDDAGCIIPHKFFITHSHGDHHNTSGVNRLLKVDPDCKLITGVGYWETDEFLVKAFPVPHDVQNHGYLITEKATGEKLVYVTDDSFMYDSLIKKKDLLAGADYYALEANYDKRYLTDPDYLQQSNFRYNVFSSMQRHTSKQETARIYAALKKDTSKLFILHKSARFFSYPGGKVEGIDDN